MIPLLLSLAHAAPSSSLALDVGRMDSQHRALSALGGDALATYGVRGVVDLDRWKVLDVTYALRFSERRSRTTVLNDSFSAAGQYETRWFHNTAALGLRAQTDLGWEGFQPFVRAQASLETGVLRLDEDTDDKDNVNELREVGLAPGVELVAGVDIVTAPFGMDVGPDISPLFFLEMGWNRTGTMDLGDQGEMQFGGYVIRGGVGVAF